MRPKDFGKIYWPSFKKMVENLDAVGQPCCVFAEHDWSRYLEYLNELPESCSVIFEFGDPKEIKEKVGQKHVVTGLYPITLLKTGTKQECIDKAKELIDILAPGGKYMFGLDKGPLTVDSINCDNARAVLEYVANNANY